jgi:5-formyltetrahydrofolate cyclo-ligase
MKPDARAQRAQMKQRRRALSHSEIQTASAAVCKRIWQIPALRRAKRVAIYMSVAGEIDCLPIAETAWLRKMRTFAPVLAGKQLIFAPLDRGTRLHTNRYQILEPVYKRAQCVQAKHLDVVIVPLLAFDRNGNRLGMGGGFYDRTFAFTRHRKILRRPLLIGVAYDFQHVSDLHLTARDVPVHAVITEKESYGSY